MATPPNGFTEATAEATGKSEHAVQRAAKRGKEIDPADLDKIAHTSLDKGDELDALAKLSDDRPSRLRDYRFSTVMFDDRCAPALMP
jgi:hypothetical protein